MIPTRALWTLWFCQCTTTLGLMMLVPILPLYLAKHMQLSLPQATQWSALAMAAPAVTSLLLSRTIGRCCDRYGHRTMVIASLLVFTGSMVTIARAESMLEFLAGRFLQGASGVSLTLLAFASALQQWQHKGKNLGAVLGNMAGATAFGCLVGPVLGGFVLDHWQLQPLLLATALCSTAAVAVAFIWLPKDNLRPVAGPPLQPASKPPLTKPLLFWLSAALLSQAAAVAMVTGFSVYLEQVFASRHSASLSGSIHAFAWLASFICSPLWGRRNDRWPAKTTFLKASAGCAAATALIPLCSDIYQVAALRFVQGACLAALLPSAQLMVQRLAPVEGSGAALGLCQSFTSAGQISGPLILMPMATLLNSSALLLLVAGLFALAFIAVSQTSPLPPLLEDPA